MRRGGLTAKVALVGLAVGGAVLAAAGASVLARTSVIDGGDLLVGAAPDAVARAVDVMAHPSGGHWVVTADGGVASHDGAPFHGSAGALGLRAPVVAAMALPGGAGYWLVGGDGGVFAFGDARFHGGLGAMDLDQPVVDGAATSTGHGYWLVGGDGGVFAFGDARFHGAATGMDLDEPVVAIRPTDDDGGYLLLGRDGGVFAFGTAPFPGSAAGRLGDASAVDLIGGASPAVVASDGSIRTLASGSAHLTGRRAPPPGHQVVRVDGSLTLVAPELRVARIAMTGDLLPHGSVMRAAWTPDGYDFAPLLAPIEPVLRGADLALCHLEVVISDSAHDVASYPRFRSPPALAAGIAGAGYHGCSTASNHALDHGLDGVRTTLEALDAAGVGHSGTARSPEERATGARYRAGGIDVAHLAYTYGVNGARLPQDAPWATNLLDVATVHADAARARADGAELVVVSIHWGSEYRTAPTAAQREAAAGVLSTGAVDVIVGHHAHVVQPVAVVEGAPVAYGLGNSLSGMVRAGTRDGVVLGLLIEERPDGTIEVAALGAIPTWNHRPHAVVPADPTGPHAASHLRTMRVLRSGGVDVRTGMP